jgi:capsular polysaccharide biosynthesis protein
MAGKNSNYKIVQLDPAIAPQSPVSPKPVKNCIIAFFLGLLLGTTVAILIDSHP